MGIEKRAHSPYACLQLIYERRILAREQSMKHQKSVLAEPFWYNYSGNLESTKGLQLPGEGLDYKL